MKERSFYEQQVDEICKELNANKQKKRKAEKLSDMDKDKLFVSMINRLEEDERWSLFHYCAKRGFIALR
jgi:hypothetical protein